ncbi:YibE/F family protein [Clostridium neuense]|uniref:YibE/F family protein n=1 Tax=Clostridium neuense TaxID=1728934 RepID=A0ABW8TE87_9CLOT
MVFHFLFNSSQDNLEIHGKIIKEINNNNTSSKLNEKDSKNKKTTLSRNYVMVKILNGDHKGETIKLDNLVNDKTSHQSFTKKGDEVLINISEDKNGHIKSGSYIYDVVRYKFIYVLVIVFVLLIALIGGMKGIKSIIGIAITGFAVLKIMLPLIMAGFDPIVVSVFICIGVSILNLLIISGKNKKTLAAIVGTCGGVIIAGVIAAVCISALRLSGLTDEEEQNIIYIAQNVNFNFSGLFFAGVLMGALGAVMDISMSIASSINEINQQKEMSMVDLIKSGMNVGKDIMGTMANTLILAYAGGAMYIMIWISSYDLPFHRILNQDVIASEAVKSLAGSIGLIFTIPLTAIFSSFIFKREKKYDQKVDKIIE